MENLNKRAADVFFHFSFTHMKEKLSAWLSGRAVRKGKGGRGVRSITWAQLLHLTTSIHHLHPPSAVIPSTHLGQLSRQIGQILGHSKVALPCTDCKPERHPKRPPLSSPPTLPVLCSPACVWLHPPLAAGELVLTVKPREGWKGQTCQAECYLNSSE